MSLIVAARFTTFAEAENAASILFGNGFEESDVSIFFVNPPGMHNRLPTGGDEYADRVAKGAHMPMIIGAGIGAAIGVAASALLIGLLELSPVVAAIAIGIGTYIGSLVGALNGMRVIPQLRAPGTALDVRHAGVLLAVHVTLENEAFASNLLKNHGGDDVERASGRWSEGRWVDFDPVVPPVLSDKVTPSHA
ncbi:hypothetical protein VVD49_19345 [Uliginosibacterium sp. H3]|uniref:DUF1269 domain-containing protein n=1 Tax=Uliginosibacterium silvisoli TaxID=3114758 RepID=A0ABU6K8F4_9RHOO|nr:hypothetical protein [Uliginosibacterium sp. H3]